MKRKVLFLFMILFLPFVVDAKEYCTIVSGNGKDIGSEIACGTEHFYVIDNDNDNIKMLAKYNLYVGFNIDKIKIDTNKTYIRYECNLYGDCYENRTYYFDNEVVNDYSEWLNKLNLSEINIIEFPQRSNWNHAFGFLAYSDKYTVDGKMYKNSIYDKLYPYYTINVGVDGFGKQNKLARGVVGEKNNANYPMYGVIHLFPTENDYNDYFKSKYNGNLDNFENGYTNFDIRNDYLYYYEDYLINEGFDVSSVDMITIKEINNLVNKLTDKNLPLSEWYELSLNTEQVDDDDSKYYNLGNLKEYLSNDYKWLWDTSYWTRTAVGNINNDEELKNAYFVSTTGEICFSASNCFSGIPRAGIRPVVTISSKDIKYNIRTKTDGKGTIEVIDTALGGESISFRVSAKKGLKLAGLIIKTDSGEVVEFSEEDLTTNSDGTISISTNKFTMPYENVLIEARWILDILNPKTGAKFLLIIFVLSITIFLSIKVLKIKKKN